MNYPFDDDEQGLATYSKSPDDAVFQQIALSYSKVSLCLNKSTLRFINLKNGLKQSQVRLWSSAFFLVKLSMIPYSQS